MDGQKTGVAEVTNIVSQVSRILLIDPEESLEVLYKTVGAARAIEQPFIVRTVAEHVRSVQRILFIGMIALLR